MECKMNRRSEDYSAILPEVQGPTRRRYMEVRTMRNGIRLIVRSQEKVCASCGKRPKRSISM